MIINLNHVGQDYHLVIRGDGYYISTELTPSQGYALSRELDVIYRGRARVQAIEVQGDLDADKES